MSDTNIRVAILGSSLAGVALLRGLLKYHHLEVDLFESRPTFRDDGLAVGFDSSAQTTLRLIDPTLDEAFLRRCGAVDGEADVRVAAGSQMGQRLAFDSIPGCVRKTISREAFFSEYMKTMPPQYMHPNKRLISIEEAPGQGSLILTFSDGLQKEYDAVIGADGIHGTARSHILRPDDPALTLRPSGLWAVPIKVPLERAQQLMGTASLDPRKPRSGGWIGDGTFMCHDLTSHGREVLISLCVYQKGIDGDSDGSWAKLFTPEEFEQMFSASKSQGCRGMIKLAQSVYTIQIAGMHQFQHVHNQGYVFKNACLLAEAAHAQFPISHETNISCEEALVLIHLLGRTTTRTGIPTALQAFDEACRPRTENVLQRNHKITLLLTGKAPGVGLDADLLARNLAELRDVTFAFDAAAHLAAALEIHDGLILKNHEFWSE